MDLDTDLHTVAWTLTAVVKDVSNRIEAVGTRLAHADAAVTAGTVAGRSKHLPALTVRSVDVSVDVVASSCACDGKCRLLSHAGADPDAPSSVFFIIVCAPYSADVSLDLVGASRDCAEARVPTSRRRRPAL